MATDSVEAESSAYSRHLFTVTLGETSVKMPRFYAETSGLLRTLVHDHKDDGLTLPEDWKYSTEDLEAFGAFVQWQCMPTDVCGALGVVDACRAFRVADYLDTGHFKIAIERELLSKHRKDMDFLLFSTIEFNHLIPELEDEDIAMLFVDQHLHRSVSKLFPYYRVGAPGSHEGHALMTHPRVADAVATFMSNMSCTKDTSGTRVSLSMGAAPRLEELLVADEGY